MIHIEGMGWLGSALAFKLHRAGLPFSWWDGDRPHTAWKASTGLVFPAGDARSQLNLKLWGDWHAQDIFPTGTVTQARYLYAHKNPPHEGRYASTLLADTVKLAHAECFAVDVPAIVNAARTQFADARRPVAAPGTKVTVIAHGFNHRLKQVMWGWSMPVKLDLSAYLAPLEPFPAALYGRVHRFLMVYAYPIPTRPGWHWAGSTLTAQSAPKLVPRVPAYVERWQGGFAKLFPSAKIIEADGTSLLQGWRPRPHNDDQQHLEIRPGKVVFPPLWHSGVRWAPQLVNEAVHALSTNDVVIGGAWNG